MGKDDGFASLEFRVWSCMLFLEVMRYKKQETLSWLPPR